MPQSEFWPFTRSKPINDDNSAKSSVLQKQLGDMEGEVKEIQMELAAIKRDRLDLYNLKHSKDSEPGDSIRDTSSFFQSASPYKDEDRHSKQSEVSQLREELIRAKNAADAEKIQREKYEAKLRDLELKLNNICCPEKKVETKEVRQYSDSDVAILKSQLKDMREETEELKITLAEKNEQLQDYRVKYLQAQQQVEELKRQLDVIEFDNKQVSDQIKIEIHKMKMQFQEKLQELAPLPDLLKGAQIQLEEARQLQKLAEDSSQQLSNELHRIKEKLVGAVSNLNQEKAEKVKVFDENIELRTMLVERKKELDELHKLLDDYKCDVLRLQEKLSQQESRFNEKSSECLQLLKDLDEIRIESNRSLNRCKDRSDSTRRYLQTQISELEKQLIQSRAQCKACQKEREDIRQRMQVQINSLQENFELVEIRLRALQTQVTSLKKSYTLILSQENDSNEFIGDDVAISIL